MSTDSLKPTLNEQRAVELLSCTFTLVSHPESGTLLPSWLGTIDRARPRQPLAHPRGFVHPGFDAIPFPKTARFEDWTVDLMRRQILEMGAVVTSLGIAEFTLLTAFLEQPRKVIARDVLAQKTRNTRGCASARTVDVYVSRLRRRLAVGCRPGDLIGTVHMRGYIFNADVVFE